MEYNVDLELVELYFLEMKYNRHTSQTWKNKISKAKKNGEYVDMLSMKAARDKHKLYLHLSTTPRS